MNKVKMTMLIAAATLVCSGAFADEDGGGRVNIPTSVNTVQDQGGRVIIPTSVNTIQERGNGSLLDKLMHFLRATDRGG